jgi:hypothetical protein
MAFFKNMEIIMAQIQLTLFLPPPSLPDTFVGLGFD